MPGAGSSPAGVGAAGHDPIGAPSASSIRKPPLAVFYDPATKDYELRDGVLVATHPVDQEAVLRLSVRRGSIPSLPTLGSRVRSIEYLTASLERQVEDMVREALDPMIRRGDVELVAVPVERVEGGFKYAVEYINLRLTPAAPRTFDSSTGALLAAA
jgi:hypothetical protein